MTNLLISPEQLAPTLAASGSTNADLDRVLAQIADADLTELTAAVNELRRTNHTSRTRKRSRATVLPAPVMGALADRMLASGTWMARVRAAGALAALAATQEAVSALYESMERTGAALDPNIVEQVEAGTGRTYL